MYQMFRRICIYSEEFEASYAKSGKLHGNTRVDRRNQEVSDRRSATNFVLYSKYRFFPLIAFRILHTYSEVISHGVANDIGRLEAPLDRGEGVF